MWQPGDLLLWRGIFRNQVWQAQTVLVVKDTRAETVVALLPGTECMVEENYATGKKDKIRRWGFKEKQWKLKKLHWHTNRLLFLLEPQKYYSTVLFWHHESNDFLCYYINYQLPMQRSQ